jgi:hypothetical protein
MQRGNPFQIPAFVEEEKNERIIPVIMLLRTVYVIQLGQFDAPPFRNG